MIILAHIYILHAFVAGCWHEWHFPPVVSEPATLHCWRAVTGVHFSIMHLQEEKRAWCVSNSWASLPVPVCCTSSLFSHLRTFHVPKRACDIQQVHTQCMSFGPTAICHPHRPPCPAAMSRLSATGSRPFPCRCYG